MGDSPLVIHNAPFDLKFLNAELKTLGYKPLSNPVVDTLLIARKMFPGQPANLDALCRRYKIDLTDRTYHGALLDSQLLAEVYLEMKGGRQQGLSLTTALVSTSSSDIGSLLNLPSQPMDRPVRSPRVFNISPDDIAAHEKLVTTLGDQAVWKKIST
jgi:DNA polymerase-3 subunit epsilon